MNKSFGAKVLILLVCLLFLLSFAACTEGENGGSEEQRGGNVDPGQTVKKEFTVAIYNGETVSIDKYVQGTTLVLSAEEEEGKVFVCWNKNNGAFTYEESFTYEVNENCVFKAVYSTLVKISVQAGQGYLSAYDTGVVIKSEDQSEQVRPTLHIGGTPELVGIFAVGKTLSVNTKPLYGGCKTYAYLWQRFDVQTQSYVDIEGATEATYQLTRDDASTYIRVAVSGTNGYEGTVYSASKDSSPIVRSAAAVSSATELVASDTVGDNGTVYAMDFEVIEGYAFSLPVPKAKHRTFLGWYDGETKVTDERGQSLAVAAGNATLTAKYEENGSVLITTYSLIDNELNVTNGQSAYIEDGSVYLSADAVADHECIGWEIGNEYYPLKEQPADWETAYSKYYVLSDEKYVACVSQTWDEQSKYAYGLPGGRFVFEKPTDWDTSYDKYYKVIFTKNDTAFRYGYYFAERFVKQKEKPEDWDTDYTRYYLKEEEEYVLNDNAQWDTTKTYYEKKYERLTELPEDWDEKYGEYYVASFVKNDSAEWEKGSGYFDRRANDSGSASFLTVLLTGKKNGYAVDYTAVYREAYRITVSGGTGSGYYDTTEDINLSAIVTAGKVFEKWAIEQADGTLYYPAKDEDGGLCLVYTNADHLDKVKLNGQESDLFVANESDDFEGKKYYYIQGYGLLTEMPSAWRTEYDKYFVSDGTGFVKNTDTDWFGHTYYYAIFSRLTEKPDDWEQAYGSYYVTTVQFLSQKDTIRLSELTALGVRVEGGCRIISVVEQLGYILRYELNLNVGKNRVTDSDTRAKEALNAIGFFDNDDGIFVYEEVLHYNDPISYQSLPGIDHYSFNGWQTTDGTQRASAMPRGNYVVTGTFSAEKHLITIISGANDSEDHGKGRIGSTTGAKSGYYAYGDTIRVFVTADPGYKMDRWIYGENLEVPGSILSFVREDRTGENIIYYYDYFITGEATDPHKTIQCTFTEREYDIIYNINFIYDNEDVTGEERFRERVGDYIKIYDEGSENEKSLTYSFQPSNEQSYLLFSSTEGTVDVDEVNAVLTYYGHTFKVSKERGDVLAATDLERISINRVYRYLLPTEDGRNILFAPYSATTDLGYVTEISENYREDLIGRVGYVVTATYEAKYLSIQKIYAQPTPGELGIKFAGYWEFSQWEASYEPANLSPDSFVMPRNVLTIKGTFTIISYTLEVASASSTQDSFSIVTINGRDPFYYGDDEKIKTVPYGSKVIMDLRVKRGYAFKRIVDTSNDRNMDSTFVQDGYHYIVTFNYLSTSTTYDFQNEKKIYTLTSYLRVDYSNEETTDYLFNRLGMDLSSYVVIDGLTYYRVEINDSMTIDEPLTPKDMDEAKNILDICHYSFEKWNYCFESGDIYNTMINGTKMPDDHLRAFSTLQIMTYSFSVVDPSYTAYDVIADQSKVGVTKIFSAQQAGSGPSQYPYYMPVDAYYILPQGYYFDHWRVAAYNDINLERDVSLINGCYFRLDGANGYSCLSFPNDRVENSANYGFYTYSLLTTGATWTNTGSARFYAKEGYIAVNEKPDDWDQNYSLYYTRASEVYTAATPEWKNGTTYYYRGLVRLTEEPDDWDTNYRNYYRVELSQYQFVITENDYTVESSQPLGKFICVKNESPFFETGKYYKKGDTIVNAEPEDWADQYDTYYRVITVPQRFGEGEVVTITGIRFYVTGACTLYPDYAKIKFTAETQFSVDTDMRRSVRIAQSGKPDDEYQWERPVTFEYSAHLGIDLKTDYIPHGGQIEKIYIYRNRNDGVPFNTDNYNESDLIEIIRVEINSNYQYVSTFFNTQTELRDNVIVYVQCITIKFNIEYVLYTDIDQLNDLQNVEDENEDGKPDYKTITIKYNGGDLTEEIEEKGLVSKFQISYNEIFTMDNGVYEFLTGAEVMSLLTEEQFVALGNASADDLVVINWFTEDPGVEGVDANPYAGTSATGRKYIQSKIDQFKAGDIGSATLTEYKHATDKADVVVYGLLLNLFKYGDQTLGFNSYVTENFSDVYDRNVEELKIPTSYRGNIIKQYGGSIGGKTYLFCDYVYTDQNNTEKSNESKIFTLTCSNSLETISNNAFKGCDQLRTVTMGTALKAIGSYAFQNCTLLTGSPLPANAPEGTLTGFEFPVSLTSIGSYAFANTALQKVTMDDKKCGYGDHAFSGIQALKEIVFACEANPANVLESNFSSVGADLFTGSGSSESGEGMTLRVMATATYLPRMFGSNNNLIGVVFETGEKNLTISDGAFKESNKLTTVTLNRRIASIEDEAFSKCALLETVIFDETCTLTSIPQTCFALCTNLTTVTLSASITEIGTSAFAGTSKLTTVYYNKDNNGNIRLERIGENAFGSLTSGYTEVKCGLKNFVLYSAGQTQFTGVIIPYSVRRLDANCFAKSAMETLILKELYDHNVADQEDLTIYQGAFSDLTSLTRVDYKTTKSVELTVENSETYVFATSVSTNVCTVDIDDAVATIPADLFRDMISIRTVEIGTGVTTIGKDAFAGLTKLTTIQFNAESLVNSTTNTIFSGSGTNSTKIVFGKDVTIIPQYLFAGTDVRITSIDLTELENKSLTIQGYAFANLNISSITFPTLNSLTLSQNAFSSSVFTTIIVPEDTSAVTISQNALRDITYTNLIMPGFQCQNAIFPLDISFGELEIRASGGVVIYTIPATATIRTKASSAFSVKRGDELRSNGTLELGVNLRVDGTLTVNSGSILRKNGNQIIGGVYSRNDLQTKNALMMPSGATAYLYNSLEILEDILLNSDLTQNIPYTLVKEKTINIPTGVTFSVGDTFDCEGLLDVYGALNLPDPSNLKMWRIKNSQEVVGMIKVHVGGGLTVQGKVYAQASGASSGLCIESGEMQITTYQSNGLFSSGVNMLYTGDIVSLGNFTCDSQNRIILSADTTFTVEHTVEVGDITIMDGAQIIVNQASASFKMDKKEAVQHIGDAAGVDFSLWSDREFGLSSQTPRLLSLAGEELPMAIGITTDTTFEKLNEILSTLPMDTPYVCQYVAIDSWIQSSDKISASFTSPQVASCVIKNHTYYLLPVSQGTTEVIGYVAVSYYVSYDEFVDAGTKEVNESSVTYYYDLISANQSAVNGDVLFVMKEQTAPSLTIDTGVTIDLNGHLLTMTGDIVINNPGQIASIYGNIVRSGGNADDVTMFTISAGSLNLIDGTYTLNDAPGGRMFSVALGSYLTIRDAACTSDIFMTTYGTTTLTNVTFKGEEGIVIMNGSLAIEDVSIIVTETCLTVPEDAEETISITTVSTDRNVLWESKNGTAVKIMKKLMQNGTVQPVAFRGCVDYDFIISGKEVGILLGAGEVDLSFLTVVSTAERSIDGAKKVGAIVIDEWNSFVKLKANSSVYIRNRGYNHDAILHNNRNESYVPQLDFSDGMPRIIGDFTELIEDDISTIDSIYKVKINNVEKKYPIYTIQNVSGYGRYQTYYDSINAALAVPYEMNVSRQYDDTRFYYIRLNSQVVTKPDDWETNWKNYYISDTSFILNENDQWAADTYYSITLLTSKPVDWETNYSNYYVKIADYSVSKTYQEGTAYYERTASGVYEPAETNDWINNIYYVKFDRYVKVTEYCEWEAGKYYSASVVAEKPTDWLTSFDNYYISESVFYENNSVTWESGIFYYKSEYYFYDYDVDTWAENCQNYYVLAGNGGAKRYIYTSGNASFWKETTIPSNCVLVVNEGMTVGANLIIAGTVELRSGLDIQTTIANPTIEIKIADGGSLVIYEEIILGPDTKFTVESGGKLSLQANVTWRDGTFDLKQGSELTIDVGKTLSIGEGRDKGNYFLGGRVINNGTITIHQDVSTFEVSGEIDNYGSLTSQMGKKSFQGSALVIKTGGSIISYGPLTFASIEVEAGASIEHNDIVHWIKTADVEAEDWDASQYTYYFVKEGDEYVRNTSETMDESKEYATFEIVTTQPLSWNDEYSSYYIEITEDKYRVNRFAEYQPSLTISMKGIVSGSISANTINAGVLLQFNEGSKITAGKLSTTGLVILATEKENINVNSISMSLDSAFIATGADADYSGKIDLPQASSGDYVALNDKPSNWGEGEEYVNYYKLEGGTYVALTSWENENWYDLLSTAPSNWGVGGNYRYYYKYENDEYVQLTDWPSYTLMDEQPSDWGDGSFGEKYYVKDDEDVYSPLSYLTAAGYSFDWEPNKYYEVTWVADTYYQQNSSRYYFCKKVLARKDDVVFYINETEVSGVGYNYYDLQSSYRTVSPTCNKLGYSCTNYRLSITHSNYPCLKNDVTFMGDEKLHWGGIDVFGAHYNEISSKISGQLLTERSNPEHILYCEVCGKRYSHELFDLRHIPDETKTAFNDGVRDLIGYTCTQCSDKVLVVFEIYFDTTVDDVNIYLYGSGFGCQEQDGNRRIIELVDGWDTTTMYDNGKTYYLLPVINGENKVAYLLVENEYVMTIEAVENSNLHKYTWTKDEKEEFFTYGQHEYTVAGSSLVEIEGNYYPVLQGKCAICGETIDHNIIFYYDETTTVGDMNNALSGDSYVAISPNEGGGNDTLYSDCLLTSITFNDVVYALLPVLNGEDSFVVLGKYIGPSHSYHYEYLSLDATTHLGFCDACDTSSGAHVASGTYKRIYADCFKSSTGVIEYTYMLGYTCSVCGNFYLVLLDGISDTITFGGLLTGITGAAVDGFDSDEVVADHLTEFKAYQRKDDFYLVPITYGGDECYIGVSFSHVYDQFVYKDAQSHYVECSGCGHRQGTAEHILSDTLTTGTYEGITELLGYYCTQCNNGFVPIVQTIGFRRSDLTLPSGYSLYASYYKNTTSSFNFFEYFDKEETQKVSLTIGGTTKDYYIVPLTDEDFYIHYILVFFDRTKDGVTYSWIESSGDISESYYSVGHIIRCAGTSLYIEGHDLNPDAYMKESRYLGVKVLVSTCKYCQAEVAVSYVFEDDVTYSTFAQLLSEYGYTYYNDTGDAQVEDLYVSIGQFEKRGRDYNISMDVDGDGVDDYYVVPVGKIEKNDSFSGYVLIKFIHHMVVKKEGMTNLSNDRDHMICNVCGYMTDKEHLHTDPFVLVAKKEETEEIISPMTGEPTEVHSITITNYDYQTEGKAQGETVVYDNMLAVGNEEKILVYHFGSETTMDDLTDLFVGIKVGGKDGLYLLNKEISIGDGEKAEAKIYMYKGYVVSDKWKRGGSALISSNGVFRESAIFQEGSFYYVLPLYYVEYYRCIPVEEEARNKVGGETWAYIENYTFPEEPTYYILAAFDLGENEEEFFSYWGEDRNNTVTDLDYYGAKREHFTKFFLGSEINGDKGMLYFNVDYTTTLKDLEDACEYFTYYHDETLSDGDRIMRLIAEEYCNSDRYPPAPGVEYYLPVAYKWDPTVWVAGMAVRFQGEFVSSTYRCYLQEENQIEDSYEAYFVGLVCSGCEEAREFVVNINEETTFEDLSYLQILTDNVLIPKLQKAIDMEKGAHDLDPPQPGAFVKEQSYVASDWASLYNVSMTDTLQESNPYSLFDFKEQKIGLYTKNVFLLNIGSLTITTYHDDGSDPDVNTYTVYAILNMETA